MTRKYSLLLPLALLLLALFLTTTCTAQSSSPVPQIFFTDLDSGPNSGGESVNSFAGAYVTLYGNFFGTSQGSSTVTWNGQNCLRVLPATGSYSGWGSSYFWYQKIVVQLGSGCTAGAGSFVVTVNGAASNGMPFTVRTNGHQYFVATSGKDTNSGGAASPFATIPHCKSVMAGGDVCYVENGVTATTQDNFSAALELETSGTAGNPIAFVAYPGATATIGNSSLSYGLRVPNINISVSYITVAGLQFLQTQEAMDASGSGPSNPSTNWRVIGNHFECPTADGEEGCFTTHEQSTFQFLGNETTNTGITSASKQQHADYFSSDTNHVVAAWNYIHDNRSCRAIQFHSSPLGGGGASDPSGHNQYDLSVHDNVIHDDPCDGINFATVDPSQGKVEAYNNVIYHVGIGPAPEDGDSGDYSCIYVAYITNTGPVGGGTVELYNNTLYDCGQHVASFANNGNFMIEGGAASLLVRLRNNVMYQLSGEPFGNGAGWNSSYVSGSNNVAFSTAGASAPSFLVANITTNPLLLSPSTNDFHLTSSSPAKDAGTTINSGNMYNNYQAWNGNPSDHDGIPRPQGSNFDIGAYEFFAGSTSNPPAPTLQSIAVAPGSTSVAVGSTVAFTATGHYSDGSTQNLTTQATWTSSTTSVATVSAGVATGVAAGGPITITAALSGISGTASLTVNAAPTPTLQTITLSPTSTSVTVGSTVAFAATGHYSDGSTKNITSQATWTSSSTSVATVSAGVATGVTAGGPVTITAAMSGVSGTASLTVNAAPTPTLQTITLSPTSTSVAVGSTAAFTATGHYSDGSTKNITSQATWTSSNTSIATVSAGVATGVAAGGPITITAALSGISGTASLTVTAPAPTPTLRSISMTPTPASVAVGSTMAFTATGHYSDGSTKNVTSNASWTSSNTAMATVASTGVATGVAAGGPITITATMSSVSGTASLTVTAAPSVTVVTFNSPVPSPTAYSAINGIYKGINFGTNQWDWEPAYLSDPNNNVYFNSSTGNSRSFQFASGTHVLMSMKVATSVAGTLTLTDNTGQTKTQNVSTGSMQLVTTGWKNASSTITITFTAGWNIEFDDITYQ